MHFHAPYTKSELHSLAKDFPKIERPLKFQELAVAFQSYHSIYENINQLFKRNYLKRPSSLASPFQVGQNMIDL